MKNFEKLYAGITMFLILFFIILVSVKMYKINSTVNRYLEKYGDKTSYVVKVNTSLRNGNVIVTRNDSTIINITF